tara:strand:- start:220 stop:1029 length:810 start_codon:yes stop_codon:yes gene_type:complete
MMLVSSCSYFNRTDDVLLARVGDADLYLSELDYLVSNNLSTEDSFAFMQGYINNWAKQELLLQKAELNIDQNQLEIDDRLEAYRRSLLIHAYEQKLIRQSIDTIITDEQFEQYYENHKDDYYLSNKIVKVMFVKASNMAPELDSLEIWLFDNDTLNIDLIEEYCHQYAKRFYNNPNEWLTWGDFEKVFPKESNLSLLTLKNRNIVLKDSLNIYFARLIDFKDSGEIAPLEYVKEEIKSILLNQIKLTTLENIQLKLLEDAKKSKQFEIY